MGPHGGLSLRGGTGCPAPHWNDGKMDVCSIDGCHFVTAL